MSSFLNRIIISRKKSPSKAQTSTMKNIFKRSLANFRQSRARIHDVAIELSTPRSATPTDTRHRTATQRTATQRTATPRSATPRSATPTDTRHRTATQRTATQRTATQRTATQRSATQRSATPTDARHRTATQRTATPSVGRPVQQEALDTLNTMRGESTALKTLTSKSINTQDEINKISRQIQLLKQRIIGAKQAEKDKYENTITNLEASKLALEKKLAEIKVNLRSAIDTIQKKNPKKGGTRKRRKYAKKH
jgi:hypothetical protein